jgi:hypothetical protein
LQRARGTATQSKVRFPTLLLFEAPGLTTCIAAPFDYVWKFLVFVGKECKDEMNYTSADIILRMDRRGQDPLHESVLFLDGTHNRIPHMTTIGLHAYNHVTRKLTTLGLFEFPATVAETYKIHLTVWELVRTGLVIQSKDPEATVNASGYCLDEFQYANRVPCQFLMYYD